MALIIFDFDGCIANGNLHEIIANAIKASPNTNIATDQEAQWALIKDIPPILFVNGDETITCEEVFAKANAEGNHLAIASFNGFGKHLIPRYLKEVLHLNNKLMDKILIISWLPANPNTADKNDHILQIKDKYHYRDILATTVLVDDDDFKNIPAALDNGYSVVHADKTGKHLKCLKENVLPTLKPGSEEYAAFKKDQKENAYRGIDFNASCELDYGLNIPDSELEQISANQEKEVKKYDIQFISATENVKEKAEKLQSGFFITTDYKLYNIDDKVLKVFEIDPDTIKNWLEKYGYLEEMKSASLAPLSMVEKIQDNQEAHMGLAMFTFFPYKVMTNATISTSINALFSTTKEINNCSEQQNSASNTFSQHG